MSDIESNLGTMVINEEEDSTMKQYGTAPGHSSYRFTTSIIICFSTMHTAHCTVPIVPVPPHVPRFVGRGGIKNIIFCLYNSINWYGS